MNTSPFLIRNVQVVNEFEIVHSDVRISDAQIHTIAPAGTLEPLSGETVVEAQGKYLLPGAIDDQVHFREPGLTHKGEIETESRAAVAGGITSYMEMPNTVPQTLTQELLEDKYRRASEVSYANYSFFMGASNDNLKEVLKTDPKSVCGVKVFMGSSTGNMLVDNRQTLEGLFGECPMLIATHCEDEATIRANMATYTAQYGDDIPVRFHPVIRSAEACYKSSSLAVELAEKHGARLHILHISTARELSLFRNDIPLSEKKITAEACIHHLWFSEEDYESKGNFIKWNPAVKKATDREAIFNAVLNDTIDVIATDHAPHTLEEKQNVYTKAPSGGPLVQHALPALLEMHRNGKISLEKIVDKTAHQVAEMFQIEKRGFIREGYFADLVLVNLSSPWTVSKSNILYKCGWSPFEGTTFSAQVEKTWVNGHLAWSEGKVHPKPAGKRLTFDR
ncbi:MAG: dihydroorotase [Flavobacteriales bacterium]|nr:dihydroorotase [Flavobacteriales bacterium]